MAKNTFPLQILENADGWETLIFLYSAALKEIGTKIEILNEEFLHIHRYNPIEHIKSRIKTPESIVKKLKKHGYDRRYTDHLLLHLGYLPDRRYDRQTERHQSSVPEGLYEKSQTQRIPELPYAGLRAHFSLRHRR